MNLYRISQTVNEGYDTYDSAIVCADSEEEAKMTHPGGGRWDGVRDDYDGWCDAKDVHVELIGVAIDGLKKGVICASFNAG